MRAALVALALLLAPVLPALAYVGLPAVVVEGVTGMPAPLDKTLLRKTTKALAATGFQTEPGNGGGSLRLSAVASAKNGAHGASVTLVWTVVDPRGSVRRLEVAATAPYQAKTAWEAVDASTIARLAETTAAALDAVLIGAALPEGASLKTTAPAKGKEATDPATPTTLTRVHLAPIKGAPGDGNLVLAQALAQFLVQFDIVLVPSAEPGAYVISANVAAKTVSASEDEVSVLWRLSDVKGKELAKVSQTNKVPAGSLAPHWGKTAVYAAEGAADGLLAAIGQLGREPPKSLPPKKTK